MPIFYVGSKYLATSSKFTVGIETNVQFVSYWIVAS